eukprot:3349806-Amphidinium_carterae.1
MCPMALLWIHPDEESALRSATQALFEAVAPHEAWSLRLSTVANIATTSVVYMRGRQPEPPRLLSSLSDDSRHCCKAGTLENPKD